MCSARATLNISFLKTLDKETNTLSAVQIFSFFNRFPLYTLPQTWNNAGIVTFYNNTTTFKIALLENPESLNQPLPLPLPPSSHSLKIINIEKVKIQQN